MQVPLQIVFRNLEPSDAITYRIRERVKWLESFCEHIISCRVAVEAPHRHHRRGNLYCVRIDVRVPGEELVVSRRPELHGAHRDMHVVIHDAFDEARRELGDYVRRKRNDVKHIERPKHAVISRLSHEEDGYGFLRTEDGQELYFHGHSVLGGRHQDLEVGSEVRFAEEMGEQGPQASSVELVGKQGRKFLKVLRKAV